MLTQTEAMQRVAAMQAQLQAKGVDGALFIFPIDVFYFSGTRQNSTLWIPAVGEPVLMVRKKPVPCQGGKRPGRHQAVSVEQGFPGIVRRTGAEDWLYL